jgi:hypothetical protein
MSVEPPPVTPATPVPAPAPVGAGDRNEITIISHSNLFYWWPIWAVGFLMALLTWVDGHRLAIVPDKTEARKDIKVAFKEGDKEVLEPRDIYVLPKGKHVPRADAGDPGSLPVNPKLHIAHSKNYGVLFATVLLLVIVFTNIPLRGMWSLMVIVLIVLGAVILRLAEWWTPLITLASYLDIRINLGGYLFISIGLFIIWLVTVLLFDRQVYLTFTPGQLKVCTEIGGGEKVYDAIGMTLEKQRSDLFRHWILGLGSGDLIVRTAGAQAHHFDLPNVLFIGKKVQMVEEMLKRRAVVGTG